MPLDPLWITVKSLVVADGMLHVLIALQWVILKLSSLKYSTVKYYDGFFLGQKASGMLRIVQESAAQEQAIRLPREHCRAVFLKL